MEKFNIIEDMTKELYRCFDVLNEKVFDSELVVPVISVYYAKNALGTCTTHKWWRLINDGVDLDVASETEVQDTGVFYEINIASNHLNRSGDEILITLMHELIHLKNAQDGIKDVSGKKHTKKFLKCAQNHMMQYDGDVHPKLGYSDVMPTQELYDIFHNDVKIDEAKFQYFYYVPQKKKPDDIEDKKTFVNWICPSCGKEAKFEEGLENVICGDCNVGFELKPKGKRGRPSKEDN